MACMAQEYHGDGDVNGAVRKLVNVGVTHVNEHKACYMGRETKGPEVMRARGRMM